MALLSRPRIRHKSPKKTQGKRWAAIAATSELDELDEPHPASVAATVDGTTFVSSVLPWKGSASRGRGAERGVDAALAAPTTPTMSAANAERARFLRFFEALMPAGDERRPRVLAALAVVLARSHQPIDAATVAFVAAEQLELSGGGDAVIAEFRVAYDNPTQETLMQLYEVGIGVGLRATRMTGSDRSYAPTSLGSAVESGLFR